MPILTLCFFIFKRITIGAAYSSVNGESIKLDSPAFIENDRTYTPIRFISEQLGADVDWNKIDQYQSNFVNSAFVY